MSVLWFLSLRHLSFPEVTCTANSINFFSKIVIESIIGSGGALIANGFGFTIVVIAPIDVSPQIAYTNSQKYFFNIF